MVRRLVVAAVLFGMLWAWAGSSPERHWLSALAWVGMFLAACLVAVVLVWRDLFGRTQGKKPRSE
jgi:hypothetical protein